MTRSAAGDLAERDFTVTGFAPGVVATELWETLGKDLKEIGTSERPGQTSCWAEWRPRPTSPAPPLAWLHRPVIA
jgi:NAD(P)-dependent dehydrogenase (short-subunit alcohol dehydrogenase family)